MTAWNLRVIASGILVAACVLIYSCSPVISVAPQTSSENKIEEHGIAPVEPGLPGGKDLPGGPDVPAKQQPGKISSPTAAGPWDQDVLVYRVNADGTSLQTATFELAGVPTVTRLKDGRLIGAHQFFPENDPDNFDKVAVRFSSDDGYTWTTPQVISLTGLPAGMRFPFDPTLVVLPDGKVRLYFTSLKGRQFDEDVPAIFSAISSNGIDYIFEPGMRFGIPGRPVIDCAVVLHQGIFHLYSPDNGTQISAGEKPQAGQVTGQSNTGYHATSNDGLSFTRVEDVKIEGNRRWLGNAQSDDKSITFVGTQQNINLPTKDNVPQGGGIWLASSVDGQLWKLLEPLRVNGADPGAVASLAGGWIILATSPPRPGTPSATRNQTAPQQGGVTPPPQPPNTPATGSDGPWNHRVLLATSPDGLNWKVAGESLVEQASVPELFPGPDGRLILIFVDASGQSAAGVLGAMVQQADGSWQRKQTDLRGADPNIVKLKDGSYRAFTKELNGSIVVYTSVDGLRWQLWGEAFRDERYQQATDPDVLETPSGWVMLLSLGPRLLRCTSADGLKFTAGEIIDLGGSVSDTVAVSGGWRTFFHVNANPQTNDKMVIRSAFTVDGKTWRIEEGNRLTAPASGAAQRGVADPAPVQLADGTWLMAVKSFIK